MEADNNNINTCPEFPFFGATYPDATCIDGYLWDLDSIEEDGYTSGGDQPCPFCNKEKFFENHLDEPYVTTEELEAYIQQLRDEYDTPTT
jgi:hypothetical protein